MIGTLLPYEGLIYSTDKSDDCLVYDYRYFCRSTNDNIRLERVNHKCIAGDTWSFVTLKQHKVTTDTLIDWLIPFYLIEEYAKYLSQRYTDQSDNVTICSCPRSRMGRRCEYELAEVEFNIAFAIKSQRSRDSASSEIATSLIDEITCNTGALALEWRQVCDGIVNCQDGVDEFNCHLLELNKCDANEFQCRSGMCVPIEFLYDVTFDCMDLSDEQELNELHKVFHKCSTESLIECDERLCRKDQFSCGDGRCVPWS